jgi:serine/threonine-protein phosphatase 2B catalytic subunit
MSQAFNFRLEVLAKYGEEVYDAFQTSFDALSLAAVVDGRFFAVHGGISPATSCVQDIETINRFQEPPDSGPMCDLLWADPAPLTSAKSVHFSVNKNRGASFIYGFAATCAFLEKSRLLAVVRGHEVMKEGYSTGHPHPKTKFPVCLTVFSAPNYCGTYQNRAAVLAIDRKNINVRQFAAAASPYVLPNFSNVFVWSLPFVCENALDIMLRLCTVAATPADGEELEPVTEQELLQRDRRIEAKIRSVSTMLQMQRTLREEATAILRLKGLASGRIPRGLLTAGPAAIRRALSDFETAQQADRLNELHPASPRVTKPGAGQSFPPPSGGPVCGSRLSPPASPTAAPPAAPLPMPVAALPAAAPSVVCNLRSLAANARASIAQKTAALSRSPSPVSRSPSPGLPE